MKQLRGESPLPSAGFIEALSAARQTYNFPCLVLGHRVIRRQDVLFVKDTSCSRNASSIDQFERCQNAPVLEALTNDSCVP